MIKKDICDYEEKIRKIDELYESNNGGFKRLENIDQEILCVDFFIENFQNDIFKNLKRDNYEYDIDSSPTVLEFYKVIYEDFLKRNELHFYRRNRPRIIIFDEKNDFEFGGDCDFNFNFKENGNGKSQIFDSIIRGFEFDDEGKREKLLLKLEKCSDMYHSFANFSLMPKLGGMNPTKGSYFGIDDYKFDRLDILISYINKYYDDKDLTFFQFQCHSENLVAVFDMYDDVYGYCKEFYFMEKDTVDKLIKFSKKKLDTAKNIEEYMDLALEHWHNKEKKLKYQIYNCNL